MRKTTMMLAEHMLHTVAAIVESYVLPNGSKPAFVYEFIKAGHWEVSMPMVNKQNAQRALFGACKCRSSEMIEHIVTHCHVKSEVLNDVMRFAMCGYYRYPDYKPVVLSLLSLGACADSGLDIAAMNGDSEMCEYLLSRGAKNYNILFAAAYKFNLSIIELGQSFGANNYNLGLCYAIYNENYDAIDWMLAQDAEPLIWFIAGCAAGKAICVYNYTTRYGTPSVSTLNMGLSVACEYGHSEMANFLIENLGADYCHICRTAEYPHIVTSGPPKCIDNFRQIILYTHQILVMQD